MVTILRTTGLLTGGVLTWLLVVPTTSTIIEQPGGSATASNGKALFETHCAACHGEQGDGNGLAARFLYPRPRDFTAAEFRLTSTTNLVPTDDDLMNVLNRGMPGSAMIPYAHLPDAERKALVQYVRQLTTVGMVRRAMADAKSRGETPDETDLRNEIADFFKPGTNLDVPKGLPATDPASVKRGQALYTTNCATCHGPTGRGDGQQDQKDASGMPTKPRDFSRGIFKGGRELEQLYYRIVLGMKGTPMPGNTALKPEEVGDIINFVQSLSTADSQAKIQHRRTTINVRHIPGELPDKLDNVWSATKVTSIVVSPLWWREYPEPDFHVKAVHDGKTIAIQLVWNDSTRDDVITMPDQFEDMASIQLFRGKTEPFLGMGAVGTNLDIWLWRASWQQPRMERPPYDKLPQLPDFATARDAGNQHTHLNPSQTAGNLAAKGAGSLTFRPKTSQVVSAHSSWSNRRWVVEFRRPLGIPTNDGLALAPGESASIAFAVWDGAVRDRNGQKQVSIWHDLKIE